MSDRHDQPASPAPKAILPAVPSINSPERPEEICSLALVLLNDESASMQQTGWRKELDGTASALVNPQVMHTALNAIKNNGPIALTAIGFDGAPQEIIAWRVMRNASDIHAFANALRMARDGRMGATNIGLALHASIVALEKAPCTPMRQTIDILTDGGDSNTELENLARDTAEQRDIQINGLGIGKDPSFRQTPAEMLASHVVTRYGFVMNVDDINAFPDAMLKKLTLEFAEGGEPRATDTAALMRTLNKVAAR